MKRDFDLIRSMLLDIEGGVPTERIANTPEAIYQAQLMLDCGFIEGNFIERHGFHDKLEVGITIDRLTSKGCDFLDLARSEEVWESVQPLFGNCSLDILTDALKLAQTKYLSYGRKLSTEQLQSLTSKLRTL